MGKRLTGFGAALLYGSKYDSFPEQRVTFLVLQEGSDIRVMAKSEIVTNPGSAFERVSDNTQADRAGLREALDAIGQAWSRRPR